MNIETAIAFLLETLPAKCEMFDLVAGAASSEGLSVFQGKVQDTELSNSVGIGVRVFKDGRPGYAFTERLSEEALSQMAMDALSHTQFTNDLGLRLPGPQLEGRETVLFHEAVEKVTLEQMADLCLDIERRVLASEEVENVPYLGASRSVSEFHLANSEGVHYSRRGSFLSAGAGTVARRGEVRKLGVYNQTVFDGADFSAEKIAGESVRRARSLLGAKPISGGIYPVVFSEDVSGKIVNMFSQAFSADSVQKGTSRLNGQVGCEISAPCFTLVNDPTRADLPGFSTFDSEGTPTRRQELIANGRLTGFLHNLETAAREGVASTGNAERSYAGHVSCGFQNLIVEPGGFSTEALTSLFPRSLLITKLEGGSGCNAVSGELSIGAQGFYCEYGAPSFPVEGLTLNTNFFDMLRNIEAVGSDYNDSYSMIRVPAFAVSEISVSN